jgi:hypothetical protein
MIAFLFSTFIALKGQAAMQSLHPTHFSVMILISAN